MTVRIAPSNRPSRAHNARIARAGELGQIISLTDTPQSLEKTRVCSVIESAMALWTHHYKEEGNPELMQRLLGSGTSVGFGEIEVPCAVSEGLSASENNGWPAADTLERAADETISATRGASEETRLHTSKNTVRGIQRGVPVQQPPSMGKKQGERVGRAQSDERNQRAGMGEAGSEESRSRPDHRHARC